MKRNCKNRLVIALALAVSLVMVSAVPALAAVTGFVARDDQGGYFQYDYQALLSSYVNYTLDPGSPAAALYQDFSGKATAAVFDTAKGYVDFSDILNAYTTAVIDGKDFSMEDYIASDSSKAAQMPAVIKEVKVAADGTLEYIEKALDPADPDDPPVDDDDDDDDDDEFKVIDIY